jgi:hypothetical protein
MAGRRSIFTPETQELILKYFRQTGNLKNSAIRAGMSERSFFRWKERCQNAQSGPLGASGKNLSARVRTGLRCLPLAIIRCRSAASSRCPTTIGSVIWFATRAGP